jgi:YbbR domain-containing protein
MVQTEETNNRNTLPRIVLVTLALLTVAALLFIALPRLQREERTLVSPIEVTGIPQGYVMTRQSHTEAKIRLIGPPAALKRTDLLRLQVHLPASPEEDGVYPVVPSVSAASPLEVLEISPTEIHIRLAQTASRDLPVQVRLKGEPAPGFRLGDVTITPATTRVSGPIKAVEPLKSIETTPISVSGASAPMKLEIPAQNLEEANLTLTPDLFTVLIRVEEIQASTLLKGVPVTPGPDEPRSVSVSPETVDIEVTGPVRLVETLKATGGVTAVIDTEGLEAGVFVRRAAITLPEGVSLIGANPELFTVSIPPGS